MSAKRKRRAAELTDVELFEIAAGGRRAEDEMKITPPPIEE
jgi:hypothetical protein